jgi:hypothetical protein
MERQSVRLKANSILATGRRYFCLRRDFRRAILFDYTEAGKYVDTFCRSGLLCDDAFRPSAALFGCHGGRGGIAGPQLAPLVCNVLITKPEAGEI